MHKTNETIWEDKNGLWVGWCLLGTNSRTVAGYTLALFQCKKMAYRQRAIILPTFPNTLYIFELHILCNEFTVKLGFISRAYEISIVIKSPTDFLHPLFNNDHKAFKLNFFFVYFYWGVPKWSLIYVGSIIWELLWITSVASVWVHELTCCFYTQKLYLWTQACLHCLCIVSGSSILMPAVPDVCVILLKLEVI